MNNKNLWLDSEKKLRDNLIDLKENYGAVSLKVSTEDAGMSFSEIGEVYRIFNDILPIVCKIGGPEAKNDMHNMINIGVSGLIAPMIESKYALQKFIESLLEVAEPLKFEHLTKHINIETESGCKQLVSIFESSFIKHISQITIGRTDLSRSLAEESTDTNRVFSLVKDVVHICKEYKIPVSIGGNITPKNAVYLAEKLNPEKINTREIGFELSKTNDIYKTVTKLLEFEQSLIKHKIDFYNYQIKILNIRKQKLKKRIDK